MGKFAGAEGFELSTVWRRRETVRKFRTTKQLHAHLDQQRRKKIVGARKLSYRVLWPTGIGRWRPLTA